MAPQECLKRGKLGSQQGMSQKCCSSTAEVSAEPLEVEGDSEEADSEEELSEESSGEEVVSPEHLLIVGKKCLAAGDATGAVDNFQEACSVL